MEYYQEIFHVKMYNERTLSGWVPAAQRANSHIFPDRERQIPSPGQEQSRGIPEKYSFASWRNASLDCVDVLHWAANATIAQLSGAEHSTVFHLHMSRVVLLAPYDSIQTLALSIAALARNRPTGLHIPSREEGKEAEQEVLHWAQRDEVSNHDH